jgi:PAS domain S-box-containing protein
VNLEKRAAELRSYVDFGDGDARLLAQIREALAPDFPRIAREFYDRTRDYEEAHAVFTGEEQIARLQTSLQAWMHRLFGGVYDAEYYEQSERIGDVHVRVGLPQRYIFAAMACLRLELERLVEQRAPAARRASTKAALHKVLDIELAMILGAYHAADVARLERREAAMKGDGIELAQAYFAATELTRELVVGVDEEGTIRIFNQGAETSTGYRREEVLHQDFTTSLLAEESRERVASLLAETTVGCVRADTFVRTRAGKLRDVRWDIALTQGGEIRAFLIGHDYTDEKVLAARSRRAEKLAAVGTLAAGLAHEIRNPLNGAQLHLAYLERTLKRNKAAPEILDAVGVVGEEIKRLASLVTEFLDFARPKPLDRKSPSLDAVVDRVAGLAESEAAAAKVTLERDLPARDVIADIDAPRVEQVLLNLVRNAIEALAPGGGGHVTLRLRRQPKSALLEVQDDGPGIPAPDAPIFDAFYTTKPEGTGLGLAITHRIVTDHDGAVEVDSRPGRTVFRVMLPLHASPERILE